MFIRFHFQFWLFKYSLICSSLYHIIISVSFFRIGIPSCVIILYPSSIASLCAPNILVFSMRLGAGCSVLDGFNRLCCIFGCFFRCPFVLCCILDTVDPLKIIGTVGVIFKYSLTFVYFVTPVESGVSGSAF